MVTHSAIDSGPLPWALVAQVEAAIVALRTDDIFRPVHVLVPNHVLGAHLARSLFADTGYLAVHCALPHEFAWRLASQPCVVDGLLPVPEEVDLAIILSAAAQAVEGLTASWMARPCMTALDKWRRMRPRYRERPGRQSEGPCASPSMARCSRPETSVSGNSL